MKSGLISVTLILLIFSSDLFSQPVGSWDTHVSNLNSHSMAMDRDNNLWVSSGGGLYVYDSEGFTTFYSKQDGLYDIGATAMAYDSLKHRIWLGFADGMISTLDIENGVFSTLNDINRSDRFISKRINRLRMDGNQLLIAASFGMTILDTDVFAIIDSYVNFGTLGDVISVNDLTVLNGVYYLATENGIAIGDPSAGDLILGSNWGFFNESNGFVSTNVSLIEVFNNEIYATVNSTNFRYNGSSWSLENGWGGQVINYFADKANGKLLAVKLNQLVELNENGVFTQLFELYDGYRFGSANRVEANKLFVGTTNRGLILYNSDNSEVDFYQPDGPFLNFFEGLSISNGILATGTSPAPGRFNAGFNESGYSIFRNYRWENYNIATHPIFQQQGLSSFYTSAVNNRYFFFGSWGSGVVRHDIETDEITVYNTTASGIRGVDGIPNYIVNIALHADRQNRIWAIQWANNTQPLAVYNPETDTWVSINKISAVPATSQYRNVISDSNNQLWITLQTTSFIGRGLMVVRGADDVNPDFFILGSNENDGNLPNDKVNAVIQDLRGEVWVGTDRGMARFIFPDRIIDGSAQERRSVPLVNEDTTVTDRVLLRDVRISALAVNAANQKWVGSEGDGIFLIEQNGRRVIRHFTATNSPLLSNNIRSIAVDNATGTVYIASDRGINSYKDIVMDGDADMRRLHIYPNPYSYSLNSGERIIIENLGNETSVNIMTVDGRLVNRINVTGGRTEWDGLDYTGRRVSTGVYLIVALGVNNNGRGTGKVLIVR